MGDGIIAAFGDKIGIYETEEDLKKALEAGQKAATQSAALTPAELDADRALQLASRD